MLDIKKIFYKIRIEEYFLLLASFFLFFIYAILPKSNFNWLDAFNKGLVYLKIGGVYFTFIFYFFIFILFLRIWFWLVKVIIKSLDKKSFSNFSFKIKKVFQKIKGTFPFIRLFILISFFFSALGGILGLFAVSLKERLVNNQLMEIDKFLFFGRYPFAWAQDPNNILRSFDYLIVNSFFLLSLALGITLVLFYLIRDRKFLSRFIISIASAALISLPLWFIFPSNSPQNTFLNNVYQKEINPEITQVVNNYQPTALVTKIQNGIDENQRSSPPISTMPSMHVAWAIIIVYLTFLYDKRTIFISLPWAILSSLGTFYLAQHYFIDILVSFPVAALALWFSSLLVKFEKKYYQKSEQDLREDCVKNQIKNDLSRAFPFKFIFLKIKKFQKNRKNIYE